MSDYRLNAREQRSEDGGKSSVPRSTQDKPMSQSLHSASSPFLELPPGIRNAVYESFFFHYKEPYVITRVEGLHPYLTQSIPGIASLLTCRQIHREARGILNAEHEFAVPFTSSDRGFDGNVDITLELASEWLGTIGEHITYVKHLSFECSSICIGPCSCAPRAVELLPLLRFGCETLSITFQHNRPPGCVRTVSLPANTRTFDFRALTTMFAVLKTKSPPDLAL